MAWLWGKEWRKKDLLKYVGDVRQIGGVSRICFDEGAGKGLSAALFNTGGGLNYLVLIDRCLDITMANYKGSSLCWHSCTGLHRPEFFDEKGYNWQKTFFGGLMITCGLTAAGHPSQDSYGEHGLHGKATSFPAEEVAIWNNWIGDELEMGIQGKMHEAAVFGDYLQWRRRITSRLGLNSIIIEDVVTNSGFRPSPFMILYHINLGFPLLSEDAQLLIAPKEVVSRDAEAEKGLAEYNKFCSPQAGFKEQVYFHDLEVDEAGFAEVALVNPQLNSGEGLGLHLMWRKDKLPQFSEWKQMGEGDYVVGLEPGNRRPTDRATEQRQGRLQILQPGEEWQCFLRIAVLENNEQIGAVRKKLQSLKK